ncbi:MAG: DUF3662 domain-containing protein [Anaerolineae bacterium]|nr:DUF3662 domain-containing protein [Anaerolineae bacterium]
MSQNRLSRLEAHIERLVEGSFARLFAGRLEPRQVAIQLAHAMEDNAYAAPGQKRPIAPDAYTVFIHPEDFAALTQAQPDLAAALGTHLVDLAARSEMTLTRFPSVTLSPSVSVPRHTVRVAAQIASAPVSTAIIDADAGAHTSQPAAPPPNARLIIEGERAIPLTQPTVNIGRRLDNHIVIDDLRISRRHAQLRLRQGRYVLFDLGSSGGTAVNGQAVQECILRRGDRIAFGGVFAVYQEDPPDTPRHDTQLHTG